MRWWIEFRVKEEHFTDDDEGWKLCTENPFNGFRARGQVDAVTQILKSQRGFWYEYRVVADR